MYKKYGGLVDVLIPLLMPKDGMTRGELAKRFRLSYREATNVLERLRKHRLLKRHIRRSQYIYTLQASRKALSVGVTAHIGLN